MPKYRATVRIEGLVGDSADDVRGAVLTKLKRASLDEVRVTNVERIVPRTEMRPRITPRVAPAEGAWRKESNAGGALLLVAAGWAVWFLWSMASRLIE